LEDRIFLLAAWKGREKKLFWRGGGGGGLQHGKMNLLAGFGTKKKEEKKKEGGGGGSWYSFCREEGRKKSMHYMEALPDRPAAFGKKEGGKRCIIKKKRKGGGFGQTGRVFRSTRKKKKKEGGLGACSVNGAKGGKVDVAEGGEPSKNIIPERGRRGEGGGLVLLEKKKKGAESPLRARYWVFLHGKKGGGGRRGWGGGKASQLEVGSVYEWLQKRKRESIGEKGGIDAIKRLTPSKRGEGKGKRMLNLSVARGKKREHLARVMGQLGRHPQVKEKKRQEKKMKGERGGVGTACFPMRRGEKKRGGNSVFRKRGRGGGKTAPWGKNGKLS